MTDLPPELSSLYNFDKNNLDSLVMWSLAPESVIYGPTVELFETD